MMDLGERIIWMLIGMGLGFVLGYIVAQLRAIEEKVDTMDEHVHEAKHRNEQGFMRLPIVADTLYFVVLLIVVFGAISAQRASNDVEETQNDLAQLIMCNREYLTDTITALNERTTYTSEHNARSVDLQEAQSVLLATLLEDPPPTSERAREALGEYNDALLRFVSISGKARAKSESNPYPTSEDYEECLEESEGK